MSDHLSYLSTMGEVMEVETGVEEEDIREEIAGVVVDKVPLVDLLQALTEVQEAQREMGQECLTEFSHCHLCRSVLLLWRYECFSCSSSIHFF
jgi:hypothetical protein